MALPGLPKKLNTVQTKTSLKSSASAAISVSERNTSVSSSRMTRSTGTSYGIFAQRTAKGKGLIYNARVYNGPYIAQQRDTLNRNRIPSYAYAYAPLPNKCNCDGDNTMNKFMAAMMVTQALAELGVKTAEAFKSDKSSSAEASSAPKNTFNGSDYSEYNLSKFTLSKELGNAKSLASIQTIENNAKTKLDNFQEKYSQDVTASMQGITDALGGTYEAALSEAGVTINIESLNVRNLNINPSDLASIDKGVEVVNQDIADVDKFISTDLAGAITKLTTTSGELATKIGSLQAEISAGKAKGENVSTLETQLQELKTRKENIDKAKAALEEKGEIRKMVDDIRTTLDDKKNELGDIKLTLSQVADKKYEVAKENDEALEKLKKKARKLEAKVDELKTELGKVPNDKPDKKTRIEGKLRDAKSDLSNVYTNLIKIADNLKIEGTAQAKFTNSKGQTYELVNTNLASDILTWQSSKNSL